MNNEPHGISQNEVKNFITLNDEALILAQRKHWITALKPIANTFFLGALFEVIIYIGLYMYFSSIPLFITMSLLIVTIAVSRIVKVIIEWYCHLYIITNRRIMEICHVPFSSYHVNDLLLDQMRVVEIDIDVGTIFNELVGKGHVIILLDQYAHTNTFTLYDVPEPRKTATYLTQIFGNRKQEPLINTLYRYQPKFIL